MITSQNTVAMAKADFAAGLDEFNRMRLQTRSSTASLSGETERRANGERLA